MTDKRLKLLSLNGETHSMAEWSRMTGISADALSLRINRLGWSVEKALTTPTQPMAVRHGGYGSPTHISWRNMYDRCFDLNYKSYHQYGGRGITMCERWREFKNFLADMGERPAGKTLDRIDPNKDYEPGNCRWATHHEQARNRQKNFLIEYNGRSMIPADWAKETGLTASAIWLRIHRGWSVERALTTPLKPAGKRRKK